MTQTNMKMTSKEASIAPPSVMIRVLVALAIMSLSLNILLLGPLDEVIKEGASESRNSLYLRESENPFRIANVTKSSQYNNYDQGRQHVLDIFQEAGINLTSEMIEALPTWSKVQSVAGTHPYIVGLDSCQRFREKVPAVERMLGSAGMFNTGTNLVTHLLKQNCEIPERFEKYGPHQSKESYGMRWQVPWGKHTPAKFRDGHATEKATKINKEYILPVITIRNPYSWFLSMCNNGYVARWPHGRKPPHCPHLKNPDDNFQWNKVSVRYGPDREDSHQSLGHFWNDWYQYYINDATYPYVVVRMEDLVFYPKETITTVCECAGGKIRTDQPFHYIEQSAKADSPGHDATTGLYQAWIKYSQLPEPKGGLSNLDYSSSKEALNQTLMNLFGYRHPPAV